MTLRAVTPLVVGGADPRASDGLRIPSLRGSLRWWLRAAVADRLDPEETLAFEQGMLGGGNAGAVVDLWISDAKPIPTTARLRMNDPRPPRADGRKAERPGLDAGSSAVLNIHFRHHADSVTQWRLAGLLDLFLLLGGMGNRWRRGFGSLWRADTMGQWIDPITGETAADRAGWVATRLDAALTALDVPRTRPTTVAPTGGFRMLRSSAARVYVVEPVDGAWTTWEKAMGPIDNSHRPPMPSREGLRYLFYRSLKAALHNWDSRTPAGGFAVGVTEIGSFSPRSPSPVTIQIKPAVTSNGVRFVGIVCVFFSDRFTSKAPPGVPWSEWDRVMASGSFPKLTFSPITLP